MVRYLRPPVVFPDVEALCVAHVAGQLATRPEPYAQGVFVSNAVPAVHVARMVTFRRDGGPRVGPVTETARLGVNVWAQNDGDAVDLAQLVRGILAAFDPATTPVRGYSDTGPSRIPDDVPAASHVYFTAELTVTGQPL